MSNRKLYEMIPYEEYSGPKPEKTCLSNGELYALLAVEEVDKWISVETPPEDNTKVLVHFGELNNTLMGIYCRGIWSVFFTDELKHNIGEHAELITGWQPLPSAPKQDKQK